MKKIIYGGFVLSLLAFIDVKAGVTFLPQAIEAIDNYDSSDADPNKTTCQNAGYTYKVSTCSGMVYTRCPYSENYYRNCCNLGQKYTIQECRDQEKEADLNNPCNGHYRCIEPTN